MRTYWSLLLGSLLLGCTLGCTMTAELNSSADSVTLVNVDSTGLAVRGLVADSVTSAVVENTSLSFSAIKDGDGVKLIPNQDISFTAGVIYKILVRTANAQSVFTIKTELPSGAIMAFNLSTCPSGWSVFSAGKGRVLVGAGDGNTDAGGTALTTRTLGDAGGREYTTGIPATSTFSMAAAVPSPLVNLSAPTSSSRPFPIYDSGVADTTVSGAKEDSNMMPFAVVTYCQKD